MRQGFYYVYLRGQYTIPFILNDTYIYVRRSLCHFALTFFTYFLYGFAGGWSLLRLKYVVNM